MNEHRRSDRRPISRALALAAALACAGASHAAAPWKDGPAPFEVETRLETWHDAERDRDLPLKIYTPVDADGRRPTILVSHGLGGTREGLAYLGEHWAGHGYVCIHMQHAGSDDAVWKDVPLRERMDAMRATTRDWRAAIARPRDVSFVIDELERRDLAGEDLAGRVDLTRLAIAGHSFGAYTVLASLGQNAGSPRLRDTPLHDDRLRAGLAMSPPVPGRRGNLAATFGSITAPILHMTGTLDDSPFTEAGAGDRRIAFDHIRGAEQYLLTLEGGDHMVFSGRRLRGEEGGERDPIHHRLIRMSSLAFFDACVMDDPAARRWLREEFAEVLGDEGTFEQRDGEPATRSASAGD